MREILMNYAWEIFNIGDAEMMDIGVARDMFVANIQNYGKESTFHYKGADEVDYAELQKVWDTMTIEEKGEAKTMYRRITNKYLPELAEFRNANDAEGFRKFCAEKMAIYDEDHFIGR